MLLQVNESADLIICEFASRYPGDMHSNVLSRLKHLRTHDCVGEPPVNQETGAAVMLLQEVRNWRGGAERVVWL